MGSKLDATFASLFRFNHGRPDNYEPLVSVHNYQFWRDEMAGSPGLEPESRG